MSDNTFAVRNKAHLRDIVVRDGYYLPTDSFADVDYLYGIIAGERWAPRYKEMKMRPCPRPPLKSELVSAVQAKLELLGLPPLVVDEDKLPDTPFLLAALATLDENHRFFSRSYMPPPRPKKKLKQLPDLSKLTKFLVGQPAPTNA